MLNENSKNINFPDNTDSDNSGGSEIILVRYKKYCVYLTVNTLALYKTYKGVQLKKIPIKIINSKILCYLNNSNID